MNEQEDPLGLVRLFSRCAHYPTTEETLLAFADGLVMASDITGIPMQEIVDQCRLISANCPTDRDLLTVARDIRAQRDRQAEEQANAAKIEQWKADLKRDGLQPEPQRPIAPQMTRGQQRLAEDRRIMQEVAVRLDCPFSQLYKKSWGQIYAAMKDLGYKLNGEQERMMGGITIPPRKETA